MNTIIVYDDYKLDLLKYPRKNTNYELTDIIMINFLMHQGFLQKLSESFMEAITNFHLCKEYYYIFKFNNKNNDFSKMRKYSAKDIMFLITETNNYFLKNSNFNTQLNYLKQFHFLDQVYYFYVRNKNFYLDLFKSMQDAKVAYFERREYRYKFTVPNDFYNFFSTNTYSALELLEINAYVQYLVQRKIIKELPIPKYLLSNNVNSENINKNLETKNTETKNTETKNTETKNTETKNTETKNNNLENNYFEDESDIDTYIDENMYNIEEYVDDKMYEDYMNDDDDMNDAISDAMTNDFMDESIDQSINININSEKKYLIKKLEEEAQEEIDEDFQEKENINNIDLIKTITYKI
jgi:hypothetical protein